MDEKLTRISSLSETLMKEIEELFKDKSFNDFYVKDSMFQTYHRLNCLTFILEKKYGNEEI